MSFDRESCKGAIQHLQTHASFDVSSGKESKRGRDARSVIAHSSFSPMSLHQVPIVLHLSAHALFIHMPSDHFRTL